MAINGLTTGQKPPTKKPPGQKLPDNKLPRIIEKINAKYPAKANLFQLGSTNPKKKSSPWFFLGLLLLHIIDLQNHQYSSVPCKLKVLMNNVCSKALDINF